MQMNAISAAKNDLRKLMLTEHRGCKDALAEERIGESNFFCHAFVSFTDDEEIERAEK
ncbi:hypothetical protein LBMAG51_03040 [Phycisphaerae bacterium]|nr:hypothetical protein LBMAG51_03040 [Phycisphaerae bacterium]